MPKYLKDYLYIVEENIIEEETPQFIGEYQKIADNNFLGFKTLDFTGAPNVGHINTGVGTLDVYQIRSGNETAFGAIDQNLGLKDPVCFLGFLEKGPKILIAKNAYTKNGYQKKGIASELFLLINQGFKNKIISDTEMTDAGEALWNSLKKSKNFSVKLFYIPTKEIFDISDIGKKKTSDGKTLIDPIYDNKSNFRYDEKPDGQRFFYLLEVNKKIKSTKNGKIYEYNANLNLSIRPRRILQSYRYMNDEED